MITACGVYGIISKEKNKAIVLETIKGLELLQHRGRESAGIAYYTDEISVYKKNGLVPDVFDGFDSEIATDKCIGHVRYSTSGDKTNHPDYLQPYVSETIGTNFSMVYNGNIKNINRATTKFGLSSNIKIDTQMIIEIIRKIDKPSMREKLIEFIKNVNGVYCLIIMVKEGMYCLRDSFGVRPLCIGRNNTGHCISSESCALGEYDFVRTVNPGELIFIDNCSIQSVYHLNRACKSQCILEHIYFMNKDTKTNVVHIEKMRYNIGYQLAIYDFVFDKKNTLVVGCPMTGIPYGKGYADGAQLVYSQFLKKAKNCGRTFILPENEARIISCKKNLYIDQDITGKDLVLLDDSLVRGNTLKTVIQKLRDNGAKSVHIRITSPPVRFPCYFGVDIPSREELIASDNTIENVRKEINADTLVYISLDTIKRTSGESPDSFCSACFDGCYPPKLLDW